MKFFSLKYDDVFREVMSHESIRKQFISDVTGIPLDTIRSARLESPYLWKWHRRQKQGILDVAVVLDNGIKVDIELQVHIQKSWIRRKLFYLAKRYTENLRMGENYDRLRKCISISILDFRLIESEENHTVYTLCDRKGNELTDLLELHIVELTKEVQAGDALTDWIQLFNTGTMEELDMIKTKNAGVLNAINVVRNMNLGRTLRQIYELRLKAKRDRWAEDEYIKDLGREEGLEKGLEKGIEAFVADYIEEGFAREQIIAKLIKRFGMSGEEAQAYYERFAQSC